MSEKIECNEESSRPANISLNNGRYLSHPPPGEEVVISGISGVFPESKNIEEFMNNIYNNVDMVLPSHRWDIYFPELPERSGKVPDIVSYDSGFFGVHYNQADQTDIQNRLMQERVIEAIFDAGMNPSDFKDTNTGVYISLSFCETECFWFFNNLVPENFTMTGIPRNMIAHRISYFLGLKGFSTIVDTACSSSLYAVEEAYRAIRLGEIDAAIVGGVNLVTHPILSLQFNRLGVLSADGKCKTFDKNANGYTRSEAAGVLILQKAKDAKRIYAKIEHAKTGCDGFKTNGITFPSREDQRNLYEDFYEECQIDPSTLSYLEAHGTGTRVGDPEECAAIDRVFTKGRTTPLLIGSVKSNVGHSEPASGVSSVIKSIIAFEKGFIPQNANFKEAKEAIRGIVEGRLKVVVDKTPFQDNRGLIGINSFGFGGANCHVLLKKCFKEKINSGIPVDNLPRLICVSGRTSQAIETFLEGIHNMYDAEYIRLIHDVFRKAVSNHICRGYTILSKSGEVDRFQKSVYGQPTPFYAVFGELDNWYEIGSTLMAFPPFSNSIYSIDKILAKKKINIVDIFAKRLELKNHYILGSMVVQIALTDLFKLLIVEPVRYMGYSYGKLLSAYKDNLIGLEEIVNCAVAINETFNSVCKAIYKTESIQDINSQTGTKLNGLNSILRKLNSNDANTMKNQLLKAFSVIFSNSEVNSTNTKYACAESFVKTLWNNAICNVDCHHNKYLLLSIGHVPLGKSEEDIEIVSLFSEENENHILQYLKALGKLYINGHNLELAKLYPEVEFPVSRGTGMISPLIEWKHGREWYIPSQREQVLKLAQRGSRRVGIQITESEWSYLKGHVIDGRNLFPATGYLWLVWETFAILNEAEMDNMNILFENCRFLRATTLSENSKLELNVTISRQGFFEVADGDTAVVTGEIKMIDGGNYCSEDFEMDNCQNDKSGEILLNQKDIYKELRLRGYNYSGEFRSIQSCNKNASESCIRWNNNWVTFMDNMLQMNILQIESRLLYVPTYIAKLKISGKKHMNWVNNHTKDDAAVNVPVFCDPVTSTTWSRYVGISGLQATSIPRKKDLGVPVLEQYVFVPNSTSLTLEESIRVNMQILLENTLVYKVQIVELIDNFTPEKDVCLSSLIQPVLGDQPMVKPLIKVYSTIPIETDVPVEFLQKLNTGTDNILIIAAKIFEREEVFSNALAGTKENCFIISRECINFKPPRELSASVKIITLHKTSCETLVLLKKTARTSEPIAIKITSGSNFSWIEPLQVILKKQEQKNVLLYAEGEPTSGILGLVNCLRREPDSTCVRCLFIMDNSVKFDLSNSDIAQQLNKNMAINILKNGQWGTYRHLLINKTSNIVSEHCLVNSLIRGDLSSLRWVEGSLHSNMEIPQEKQLVYTNYVALNFRDVMLASGKLNADVITPNRLDQECVQGMEFAGKTQDGRRVLGIKSSGATSTLVLADKHLTSIVPDSMSLAEAATIPVVYGTVVYGLITRAHMKHGDSILIHSGTGGVGQAAIRIALHYGCNVFTTVGTEKKREFLKKTFPQLQDSHIGSSRNLSFEKMIKKETKGQGVDLVLNSLAGEKLIASIRCLARGGTMIEIGKFDLANNSEMNLLLLEKEASFIGVMLDYIFKEDPKIKHLLMKQLTKGIEDGYIKPIDASVFKFNQVEEAYRYMFTGQHMGKVLIEVRPENKDNNSGPNLYPCIPRYCACPSKTYIILGGLGGFGLELADWLILRGAKNIVLTSRNGISNGYQYLRFRIWQSYGVQVQISTADITTEKGCERLLNEANNLAPVDVIFNLAVVLADAVFENQTAESFKTSFGPKSIATYHLDKLSRQLCPALRNFVIFSSVTCGRGNAGQTNYGMANSVMERLCEKRKKEGFPALAIQWGAIGEVGLVAEMQEEHIELEISGTLQQKISNCMNALDTFLTQTDSVIVSSMVVAEKKGAADAANNMMDAVLNILGVESKSVSVHSTLAELGMDSMSAVEIKQTVERDYDVFLTAKDMKGLTLAKLKEIQEKKNTAAESDSTKKIFDKSEFNPFISSTVMYEKKSELMTLIKARTVESSSKIFFFPGIEGDSLIFEEVAAQLNAQILSFRYTQEISVKTLQELSQLLLRHMLQELSPSEPFRIIAYSYGCLPALEIVHILESRGHTGSVVLVDTSPTVLKNMVLRNFNIEDEVEFQTEIIYMFWSSQIPPEEAVKLKEKLQNCKSWIERVDLGFEVTKSFTAVSDIKYPKSVINGFYQRARFIIDYKLLHKKLVSPVRLIRAKEDDSTSFDKDYGLASFFENIVAVNEIEATHSTIFQNEETVTLLKTWLAEDFSKNN